MRTVISIDDELLDKVKRRAQHSGRSIDEVIAEALREAFESRSDSEAQPPPEIPVFEGGFGLQPGVDLNNSRALLDLMEGLTDGGER